jgi:hypothetical protein
MQNIDIDSFSGSMRARPQINPGIASINSVTFTVDTSGATLATSTGGTLRTTAGANVPFNATAVTFSSTGTLPGPLVAGTQYYIVYVSDTTFRFTTSYIAAVNNSGWTNFTTTGTGVHTVTPVPIGTIKHIKASKRPGQTFLFAIDSNGRVWVSETVGGQFHLLMGNTIGANSHGNGIEIFHNSDMSASYLFVFRDDAIDVINVTMQTNLATPVWTTSWKSLITTAGLANKHASLLGQDNILYYTDSRYVGSIQEVPGSVFNPATPATYTFNGTALTLPNNEYAYCLAELNLNLLVGGQRSNKIYPWDRSSVSYGLPLLVPENSVYELVNLGNTVIVLAGVFGNIYKTQGTYIQAFAKIPTYISNNTTSESSSPVNWGGVAVKNGGVLIGAGFIVSPADLSSGLFYLDSSGRITEEAMPSTLGNTIYAVYCEANNTYVYGGGQGVDIIGTVSSIPKTTVGTYNAKYQSALFSAGNNTQKKKFSQLEIQCGRAQGGYIRVGYRTSLDASFTTLATFTSNQLAYSTDIGLIDIENIQIQAEFDNNVEITEIALFS